MLFFKSNKAEKGGKRQERYGEINGLGRVSLVCNGSWEDAVRFEGGGAKRRAYRVKGFLLLQWRCAGALDRLCFGNKSPLTEHRRGRWR